MKNLARSFPIKPFLFVLDGILPSTPVSAGVEDCRLCFAYSDSS
uniref:Uncharacterized protein n=1 Tax=Myoviridae sp. ctijX18 TaxID=2825154 RepID=A0A8S5USX6_9CAUD|nr:MAG TPA: hypothetical protein [Myoviridae sp. ctijX18]DAQ61263.1 MAG TPA: hypothetical protein [Caudoviricetes sp.]